MPYIILAEVDKIDGALKGPVYGFLQKLSQDDTAVGLHIEPIKNVRDPRVRTGRVNDNFRAVLFKLPGGDDSTYVFVGAWPHDEAIRRAQAAELKINPINGIPEVRSTSSYVEAEGANAFANRQERPTPEVDLPVEAAVAEPILVGLGISLEDLVAELGIDEGLAQRAMKATTEDEIILLVEDAVPWQEHAIIALAAGQGVHETKEELGIGVEKVAPIDESDDEAVLKALRHPAAQMQFAFIEDDEELRAVLESGDFLAWRTFLHPEQRKYATGHYNGPFRLSGGAGTGKTVVLIHRARELARRDPNARILLTTFTTTLADSLKSGLKLLDPQLPIAEGLGEPGIYVVGIDALASRVYRSAGAEARSQGTQVVLGRSAANLQVRRGSPSVWKSVVDSYSGGLDGAAASPSFLETEYAMVVLPARITSREDYFAVRRPGRGVALDRAKRAAVWDLVEAYRAASAAEDAVDYVELAAIAGEVAGLGKPLFDHALVDEGQDLNPSHWQLLRAVVGEGPDDLFIAEDSHQRVYGHPVVLGRLGINIVGRSRRLTLNYRTTAQNLNYAISILSGEDYVDVEGEGESVAGYRSARIGPRPSAVAASSLQDELDKTLDLLQGWIAQGRAPETLGVLVRDKGQMARVVNGLGERGLGVRQVDHDKTQGHGKPVVMTMHRAKGMEFECVIIFGASRDDMPASYLGRDLVDADKADFLRRERSLLYVSASRARDELVVLWSGEPSEMLPG